MTLLPQQGLTAAAKAVEAATASRLIQGTQLSSPPSLPCPPAEMLSAAERAGDETGVRLGMRIGMHSGACVAGVIRADKSRFQLFGDTVRGVLRCGLR